MVLHLSAVSPALILTHLVCCNSPSSGDILIFCELGAHAKCRTLGQPLLGEKEPGEKKKKEKKKNAVNS
jgi:hypothetical protein